MAETAVNGSSSSVPTRLVEALQRATQAIQKSGCPRRSPGSALRDDGGGTPSNSEDDEQSRNQVVYSAAEEQLGVVLQFFSESKNELKLSMAEALLRNDIIVLLLLVMQRCVDRLASQAFRPTGSSAALRLSDACLLVLEQLRLVGGELQYEQMNINAATGTTASHVKWEHESLQSLELLDPFVAAGELIWPIQIAYHEPGCSVIDVVETCADGALERMRHLVLGVWKGANEFRETEVDLTKPNGATLENFYTCTLAGIAAFHLDSLGFSSDQVVSHEQEKRILIIGLGGGAIPSFIQFYFPRVNVDAVEISEQAARMAEQFFGLKCEPTRIEPGQKVDTPGSYKPLPNANTLQDGGKAASRAKTTRRKSKRVAPHNSTDTKALPIRPCNVTVADASVFVQDKNRREMYDFVIVDVYTEGKFPAELLAPEANFFQGVHTILKPGGAAAVNAGYGSDESQALDLAKSAFHPEYVQVLVDENAILENDRDHENAVLLLKKSSTDLQPATMNAKTWKEMRSDRDIPSRDLIVPRLPFLLDSCNQVQIRGATSEVRLFWKQAQPPKKPKIDAVTFASKDDAVWDLF